MQEDFGDKGLVVLAVSSESDELVSEYIDKMGINVRVAAGFSSGDDWGVRGYPSAALINADGEIVWTGHPSSISSSKVKDALKGAKASKGGYLGFNVRRELPSQLKGAVKAASDGKLAKAHAEAMKLSQNEKLDQAIRDEAQTFAGEIVAHATMLQEQGETFIKSRYMLKGIGVLESVADAMKGTELAGAIEKRLGEIADDEELQNELAAEEALAKAMEAAEKRGMKKSIGKFEAVVKKFEGTKAADRARKKMREK